MCIVSIVMCTERNMKICQSYVKFSGGSFQRGFIEKRILVNWLYLFAEMELCSTLLKEGLKQCQDAMFKMVKSDIQFEPTYEICSTCCFL